jgi:putative ABC transport system permease protein
MDILPILATLRRHKITAALLILQIALTCAIVCNAVFLITQRLQRMDMPSGIAERELLHLGLADIGRSADEKARTAEDIAALRQVPGVTDVASVNQVPFGNSSWNSGIKLDPQRSCPR